MKYCSTIKVDERLLILLLIQLTNTINFAVFIVVEICASLQLIYPHLRLIVGRILIFDLKGKSLFAQHTVKISIEQDLVIFNLCLVILNFAVFSEDVFKVIFVEDGEIYLLLHDFYLIFKDDE